MKKAAYLIFLLILLSFIPLKVFAGDTPPPFNYRIGGTFTVNGKSISPNTFSARGYVIKVTKDGNIPLDPVAEATFLLEARTYVLDIPVYDSSHTGAATPGETLEIHVYRGGKQQTIITPLPAEVTMGEDGESDYTINIDVKGPSGITGALSILLLGEDVEDSTGEDVEGSTVTGALHLLLGI